MKTAALFRPALLALALLGPLVAQAQQPNATTPGYLAAQSRWKSEFDAFANADRERAPAIGGVLFVGSSSIRLWPDIANVFRQQPVVINRGFGGSTMEDCSLFAHDLVVRYRPRQVLVYAGDNDLAEGRTPLEVLESFARFVNTVRSELPDARITFISVKPSPSREKMLPQVRETNNVIAAYLKRLPNSEFVDIYTPMVGADGLPRRELFRADMLHLNDEGYRLWQSIIAERLSAAQAQ